MSPFTPVMDIGSSVVYTPWTDGHAVGFVCVHLDTGDIEYVYLNPSHTEDDDGQANVFLYQGPHGDPALDTPYHHYNMEGPSS